MSSMRSDVFGRLQTALLALLFALAFFPSCGDDDGTQDEESATLHDDTNANVPTCGATYVTTEAAKCDEARAKFKTAMDDDLNTPDALAAIFDLVKDINTLSDASDKATLEAAAKTFDELTGVLGLLYNRKKTDAIPAEVTALVEERAAAKKAKDWGRADAIRAQLTEMGWSVTDTAQGPKIAKL